FGRAGRAAPAPPRSSGGIFSCTLYIELLTCVLLTAWVSAFAYTFEKQMHRKNVTELHSAAERGGAGAARPALPSRLRCFETGSARQPYQGRRSWGVFSMLKSLLLRGAVYPPVRPPVSHELRPGV